MSVVIEELEVQQAPPLPEPQAPPPPAGVRAEIEAQPLAEALARLQWQQARVHSD